MEGSGIYTDSSPARLRVYPTYDVADRDRVQPFIDQLGASGFHLIELMETHSGQYWSDAVHLSLIRASDEGFLLLFWPKDSLGAMRLRPDLNRVANRHAILINIFLHDDAAHALAAHRQPNCLHAYKNRAFAPGVLADMLLNYREHVL